MQLKNIPASQGIAVLYGHRILPEIPGGITPYAHTTVTCSAFEEFFRTHKTWQALSLEDLFTGRYDPLRPAFALTLDDGYKDNKIHALPILEKYNVPVTIFVTGGFCFNGMEPFEHDLASRLAPHQRDIYTIYKDRLKCGRLQTRTKYLQEIVARHTLPPLGNRTDFLDWRDIREMAQNPFVTFGWHTQTHPLLTRLAPWDLYGELNAKNGEWMRPYFAYPYGGQAWWVRLMARLSGFSACFTTKPGYYTARTAVMAIPRIALGGGD